MNKRLLAGAIAAASLIGVSAANATTYVLNYDSCSGGGCGYSTYGTVDVTGTAHDLTVSISLDPNIFFNQAGGGNSHDAVAFSLVGNPDISISGLPSTFAANGAQSAGSNHEDGLGTFDYVVDWAGPPNNNGSLGVQTLTFDITNDVSDPALVLDFNPINGHDIYFSVDVAAVQATGGVLTGVVGATTAVPEPATWAVMLMGFGAVGAAMRRTRRQAALA